MIVGRVNDQVTRSAAISAGWLRADEVPWIGRLSFPLHGPAPLVGEHNREVRDVVLGHMLDGSARPRPLPCCLGGRDDLLLAEVDRYGFPLRIVMSQETGLVRTDPYYTDEYLVRFYRDYFRTLYTPANRDGATRTIGQIGKAEELYRPVHPLLPPKAKILDCGCGTGALLIPWHLRGYPVWGCDYDTDWLAIGARLGLRVSFGSHESVARDAPFDLVILNYVLQNLVDPVGFLTAIRSLLSDQGLLYVETCGLTPIPDGYGLDVLRYFQNENVWYFTKDTLLALLRRCGFDAVSADERVRCLARKAEPQTDATCKADGRIMAMLRRKEMYRTIIPERLWRTYRSTRTLLGIAVSRARSLLT